MGQSCPNTWVDLPFQHEETDLLKPENVLALAVSSRWLNVPPSGSPKGPRSIDYLLPGGITGGVSLRAVPTTFISDVFAKPVHVLDAAWRAEVTCRVDSHGALPSAVRLRATLYDGTRSLATASEPVTVNSGLQASGSLTPASIKNWQAEWHQDVFAFDDYHAAPDGSVGIEPPLPGVPYLVTETVGQFDYAHNNFTRKYARAGDPVPLMEQALLHAQAHSKAAAYSRCAGVIAWCAFDYPSLINASHAMKCPGVTDLLRVPKLGAAFYMAQVDPSVRAVIEPDFYWDFGPKTPAGPGERSAIFSNCDRLESSWMANRKQRWIRTALDFLGFLILLSS